MRANVAARRMQEQMAQAFAAQAEKMEAEKRRQIDRAVALAVRLACVALNETEGLGRERLARFAAALHALVEEYGADPELGEERLHRRMVQLGMEEKEERA